MSKKNFSGNISGKGYYIALILCAVAIGISGYLYYRAVSQPEDPQLGGSNIVSPGDDVQAGATLPGGDSGKNPTEPAKRPFPIGRPVSGETTKDYAMDCLSYNETTRDWRVHNGVDIAAEEGSDVLAAADGTVYTVYEDERLGHTVVIRHQDGYVTTYSSMHEDVLVSVGQEYCKRGWVMQLHFSCFRNPNSKMFAKLGADCGFDCIAVTDSSAALHSLMDAWEKTNELPKTIVYSLNPADNQWLDTLLGAYQSSEIPGKIQHGSAWWFSDTKSGMENQLKSLANLSILGNFVGMLTDSRSFLSYTRHEYFRRILCGLIGEWVENGEYPLDLATLGELVEGISYNNAKKYFNI